MKKSLLGTLALVCAMTLPALATLNRQAPEPSVQKISEIKLSADQLKGPASVADVAKQNTQLLLSFDDGLTKRENRLATTELKINLDNFDMEYVLKVQ